MLRQAPLAMVEPAQLGVQFGKLKQLQLRLGRCFHVATLACPGCAVARGAPPGGLAGPLRSRAGGYRDRRPSISSGGDVGRFEPLAGSTVRLILSPAARPDTTTGLVIPVREAASIPAALSPRGPISHSS